MTGSLVIPITFLFIAVSWSSILQSQLREATCSDTREVDLAYTNTGLYEATICVGGYINITCSHGEDNYDPRWKKVNTSGFIYSSSHPLYSTVTRSACRHILQIGPAPITLDNAEYICSPLPKAVNRRLGSNRITLHVNQDCATRMMSTKSTLVSTEWTSQVPDSTYGFQFNVTHGNFTTSNDKSLIIITTLLATSAVVVITLGAALTCVVGCVACRKVAPLKDGVEEQKKCSGTATGTDEAENPACLDLLENPAYIPLSESTNC